MKKQNNLIYPSLLMGLFLVFANSCDKENDEITGQQHVPVLVTTEVTDISQTTATAGGIITLDGGEPVTARGVCWGTTESPTISDSKTEEGTDAISFTSSLTNLKPNTKYYVRAYAANSEGMGYGCSVSFTTQVGGDNKSSFTDPRDGNIYQTVTIGKQVWMVENLRYLPSVVGAETASLTTPYYYVYDYYGTNLEDAKATANYETYGVLYNWEAAKAACPAGWHLPSHAEWIELSEYLGGTSVAGGKLKESGTANWFCPNLHATNETGFTALPGGYRDYGGFSGIGRNGNFWSATESRDDGVWNLSMAYDYSKLFISEWGSKESGFYVRCVMD